MVQTSCAGLNRIVLCMSCNAKSSDKADWRVAHVRLGGRQAVRMLVLHVKKTQRRHASSLHDHSFSILEYTNTS
jgi:hypothetical protein